MNQNGRMPDNHFNAILMQLGVLHKPLSEWPISVFASLYEYGYEVVLGNGTVEEVRGVCPDLLLQRGACV